MSQIQRPRPRTGSTASCLEPPRTVTSSRSPTRSLLRSVQRRSTTYLPQIEVTAAGQDASNAERARTRPMAASPISKHPSKDVGAPVGVKRVLSTHNENSSHARPPLVASDASRTRRNSINGAFKISPPHPPSAAAAARQAQRVANEREQKLARTQSIVGISGRRSLTSRPSSSSFTSAVSSTTSPASTKLASRHETFLPTSAKRHQAHNETIAQSSTSSPFRTSSKAQKDLEEQDVAALRAALDTVKSENARLASQLADARAAQSDAEARVEQSRIEAARSRDEANEAILDSQEHRRRSKLIEEENRALRSALATIKSQVADRDDNQTSDKEMPRTSALAQESADSDVSISASVDALRCAAESGHGLTREAARAIEREFAGQERILKALQHDNEVKTRNVTVLKRTMNKLEAFCSKFFAEQEWRAAIYGENIGLSEDGSGCISPQSWRSKASRLRQSSISTDCFTGRCDIRLDSSSSTVPDEAIPPLPSAQRAVLQPYNLKSCSDPRSQPFLFPSSSSPMKGGKRLIPAKDVFASFEQSDVPLNVVKSDASCFVSAYDCLDTSSFATAAGSTIPLSPSKGSGEMREGRDDAITGITLEWKLVEAVIETQKRLLEAVELAKSSTGGKSPSCDLRSAA